MTVINESYPNIGHVLNRLADIADTKTLARKGQSRYRKEEDFSSRKTVAPELISESINHLFYEPISDVVSKNFAEFFSGSIWLGINYYIELIKLIPMEGVAQEKIVGMLNKHLVVETLASMVWKLGKINMPGNNDVPRFYCDKNPIKSLIYFFECQNTAQEYSITKVFANNIRTANKWRNGSEIPNIGHLSNLANWASLSNPDAIHEDKESLFMARFISVFHKNTNFKYVDDLKRAVVWRIRYNQEPTLDLVKTFHEFYFNEIKSANLYDLSATGNSLHKQLRRTTNKPTGSLKLYSTQLKELEQSIAKHDLTNELQYHQQWLWGRIYILSGQIDKALDMYVEAVESSLYKSGGNTRDLFKEALAVASIQTKPHKPTIKKLKSRALTFNPKVIEEYLRELPVKICKEDIDSWRLWFVLRFPQSGWFEEGKTLLADHLDELGLRELAAKCH